MGRKHRVAKYLACCGLLALAAPLAVQPAMAQSRTWQLREPSLSKALREYARLSGRQIIFTEDLVRGKRAPALIGSISDDAALDRLLGGSGLVAERTPSGAIMIVARAAQDQTGEAGTEGEGVSEILVTGARSLNGDVRRTEDDVQPYVVFSRADIERSGVSSLEEFFRTRLPMNSQQGGTNQASTNGNYGQVALRGLSAEQTLILIDGRRVPGVGVAGPNGTLSFNLNGIPTSAIERIEVLPATAGGIYGGNATAGVINIILKRDYSGVEIQATYGDTFDRRAPYGNVSVNGGFSIAKTGTSVSFGTSQSWQNDLQFRERDFLERARALNWATRPADFVSSITAYTPNICSTVGTGTTCVATAPNLVLDPAYGGTALNSQFTSAPVGYGGVATSGTAALVSAAGRPRFDAAENYLSLYSAPRLESYMLGARQKITGGVEAFVDFNYDHTLTRDYSINVAAINLPADDPANPFQQSIAVNFALPNVPVQTRREIGTLRARGGVIARLPGGWSSALEHSWTRGENRVSNLGNYNVNSSAAALAYLRSISLRDPNLYPADSSQLGPLAVAEQGPFVSTLNDTIARLSGPLFRLPGGPVTLSGYLERRKEVIDGAYIENNPPTAGVSWYPPKSQEVRSGYVEARVPLVSASKPLPFIHELELFGSIRNDRYTTVTAQGPVGGSYSLADRTTPLPSFTPQTNRVVSTDYTVGLRFAPVRDLALRASFGTGFLPPNLGQITGTSTVFAASLTPRLITSDPKRGNTPAAAVPLTQISGGSANLQPEDSKSLSLGAIFTPRFLEGLRLSADFTRIRKTNEIAALSLATSVLREDELPGAVVRGPNLPGDAPGWAGPITQVDRRARNLATSLIEAWDFQADYRFDTSGLGKWHVYGIATLQTKLSRRTLASDPLLNAVGFTSGPLHWRGNFGAGWEKGGWTAGWDAQFYDRHRVCLPNDTVATCNVSNIRQGSSVIPAQLYHDLFVTYRFKPGGVLGNTSLRLSIQNVFDTDPPIVATTFQQGYDLYGDPRLRRFVLTLRRQF